MNCYHFRLGYYTPLLPILDESKSPAIYHSIIGLAHNCAHEAPTMRNAFPNRFRFIIRFVASHAHSTALLIAMSIPALTPFPPDLANMPNLKNTSETVTRILRMMRNMTIHVISAPCVSQA